MTLDTNLKVEIKLLMAMLTILGEKAYTEAVHNIMVAIEK